MLEEYGKVVALEPGLAWVETVRISSCQSCSARSACGQKVLAKVVGQKSCVISALNTYSLQVGDRVVVGVRESTFLKTALLVYLLPLVMMIGGAVFSQWVFGTGDLTTGLGGFTGLAAGFLFVYRFNLKHQNDMDFQPIVLRSASEGVLSFTQHSS